jgi:hypothetical protein
MQQLALDTEDESRMEDAVAAAPASTDDAESAAALSHELNQPLAAIVASAQACSQWLSADPPNTNAPRSQPNESSAMPLPPRRWSSARGAPVALSHRLR